MSLELSTDVELRVREYAAAEGVSVSDLIARTFPPRPRPVPADDPVLQFLNARLREAENATPEEIAAADVEYRQWQRNMNETRRESGERLLFPEVEP
ncbi:MAG: hypothetical protein H7Y38_15975 [Armatimonadetes bacterium]|nr:hypothetical protein [Armatimonadota bacterium]